MYELCLFEVSNIGNLLALHYVTRESSSKSDDVDLAKYIGRSVRSTTAYVLYNTAAPLLLFFQIERFGDR